VGVLLKWAVASTLGRCSPARGARRERHLGYQQSRSGAETRPASRLSNGTLMQVDGPHAVHAMRRCVPLITALAVLTVAVTSRAALAQGVDVIRGQVTGPDNAPIENANVAATSLSGAVTRSMRTDQHGRYTITFPGGEGDYFMTVTAIGFAPKRFEVKRTADEAILVADATLQRAAPVLDTVRVAAARSRVNRNDRPPDISGTEQMATNAAVAVAQQGDLNAMAPMIPGVSPVLGIDADPAGFSVLGLPPDMNNMTLNGSPFGSSRLPRDANVATSLVATPYDVSRGGFSGAQFNIRTASGSNFIRRNSSLVLDAPALQWTDPIARMLGQQYSSLSLGGSLAGPIIMDEAFYNISYQLGRRSSDLRTLLNTDPIALQASGISADSVSRFIALLGEAGLPLTVNGRIPPSRVNDNGSVFGSIDVAPSSSSSGQALNATFYGSWNRESPVGMPATDVPARGGDRASWNLGLQGNHSMYVQNTVLSETAVGVNGSRNHATRHTALPSASVLVHSAFADGTSAVRPVGFGGNPFLSTSSTTLGVSATNQLSWFSINNKHRLKLTSELRQDAHSQDQTTNLLGSFVFNSLADLQANRPASFTRSLASRVQSTSQATGALSFGDSYKWSSDLQIQYGLRLDANRFSTVPLLNPDVEWLFGVRNDEMPNRVYVSPRVAFSWTYGEAPQVAAFEGAMRGPRAVVRGGVGVFQNVPASTLLGGAIDNTGLPSAVQQLTCVGAAVPVPAWASYAADASMIPAQCADGSSGTPFATSAPNVTLFARDYHAPRSVRGNLQWSGPILSNRFALTAEATYSRNQHEWSFIDLNFRPEVQFTLPDEGGRPVYVAPSSIFPQTGAIAAGDARVSPLFNHVSEQRSDLIGDTRQLRVSLSPTGFRSEFTWSASYVYSHMRQQMRGFSSGAEDPLALEWARGDFGSRHQITYQLGYNFFDAVRVNWFGRFASGGPFTPMIAGDINGDGYANDRAFIFDSNAQGVAPAVASAMRDLLTTGSASARDCLSRQLGRIARRNSCEGPWTSTATLNLSFNPLKLRLPQRATLSVSVSNPLGAADLVLHGPNNLHGWGQLSFPDPTLLYVRSFDPPTRRFNYEVNPRFGGTNPQFSPFRSPVAITAQLRVDIGPSRERQVLTQQLGRGRTRPGPRLTAPVLKAIYGTGGVLNPMALLLRQSDTLGLTGVQADSLASMNHRYAVTLDSIWSGAATALANMPVAYDEGEAYRLYTRARESSVDLLIALAPAITALLTPEQRRRLPALVASHIDRRYLAGIRSGTQGNTDTGLFVGEFVGANGERVGRTDYIISRP
jgi:hypothetical protein